MRMDRLWNEHDEGNLKHTEKTLFKCHVAHHKCHMDWSRIETWHVILHILLMSGLFVWLQFCDNNNNNNNFYLLLSW